MKGLIFSETPASYPQRMARGRIQKKKFFNGRKKGLRVKD